MRRSDAACSVEGCDRPARGPFCTMHYQRLRKRGELGGATPERGQNLGPCSFPGCDGPMRKSGYCASHYNQIRTGAEPQPLRRWSRADTCVVCGNPSGKTPGRRKYCSGKCAQLAHRYPDGVPDSYQCALCGERVDLVLDSPHAKGRRTRSTAAFCRPCRRALSGRRHCMTAIEIAQRDGTDCSICGDPVDMTLRRPASLFGPSVDHIIPRALGGPDEPENVALAHYWCNAVKHTRTNFTLRREVA